VFPGVAAAVERIRRVPRMVKGLLTGNCESAARIKLDAAKLGGFAMGAYGEHHEDQAYLQAVAVEQAERVTGKRFQGEEIVLIGDAPNDIRCGWSLGVKSIAVATGRHSRTELADHDPDFVFADLSDLPALPRAVEA
jgi:phosphoglycolate phosphatase-like HAD superfamily hydrolase